MLRFVFLCIAFAGIPVWAAEVDVLRLKSNFDRNAQEQTFVRQQMQLTQGLLRAEESRRLVAQSYIRLQPASRLDPLRREVDAPSAGVRPQQEDLDLLAGRYRDLEQQRRRLIQTLSTQVHQREHD
jgi:hypothetical protein